MKRLHLSLVAVTIALVPALASAWHAGETVGGGYRLPRDHRFETPDASGNYQVVDIKDVPSAIQKGRPIFDRTAKVWVKHPNGTLNQQYVVAAKPAAPATPAPPAAGTTGDLVAGGYRLPRDHRYESPDASGNYLVVDVKDVPSAIQKGRPIFDRTANVWVRHPNGTLHPQYVVKPGTPGTAAPAAAPATVASPYRLPRGHQYESPDATGMHVPVNVDEVPALIQQGRAIFDRTSNAWVRSPNGTVNPEYVQPGR
jgi:hypothetical protein